MVLLLGPPSWVVAAGACLLLAGSTMAGRPREAIRTWRGDLYACKIYHDDDAWPDAQQWRRLNESVGGHLLVDVPPGAVCHDAFHGPLGTVATYDAAQCAEVAAQFSSEQWTIDQPAAALWTYFTNDTCRPTTDPAEPCTLGYYPVYVILAQTLDHVRQGLLFAKAHNLRLVIRNTGHDFLGRSVGWGALVVNTHAFQDVAFVDAWDGPGDYDGPAVTVGAGVEGRPLLVQAHARSPPQTVVVGECPTVGVAGGLPGGGGHGPLTTAKGFAVDSALQFTVMDVNGSVRTANAESNRDLFWALRGGGPGTYAIILDATYRTHVDAPSAGLVLEVNSTHTNDTELFWAGVRAFHRHLNHLVDDGGLYVYYEIGTAGQALRVHPIVAFGQTSDALARIVQPLLDDWAGLGLAYHSSGALGYATWFDLYVDLFEDEAAGGSALTGGWAFARDDVASRHDAIVDALRGALEKGALVLGHAWSGGGGVEEARWADVALHPRLRNVTDKVITALPLAGNAPRADKAAAQHQLTYVIDEALRQAGPHGAAYVNEADPFQPDWQDRFWGPNYDRLAQLKRRWDPDGVFYAVSTPGTEDWVQIEDNTRLYRRLS